MQQTGSEYQEARFKKGVARQTKENGHDVNKSVKINTIPTGCQLEVKTNSDLWLEGVPKGVSSMDLTFPEVLDVTTNSMAIKSDSLTVHQYTFDIYKKPEDAQDPKGGGGGNGDIDETALVSVTLSGDERRNVYMKLSSHVLSS